MSRLPITDGSAHKATPPDAMATRAFFDLLEKHGLDLSPVVIETLQMNVTRLCNQACRHCHVDAGPKRTEHMAADVLDRCLDVLARHPELRVVDITGGAPELHPRFDDLVFRARSMGKHVMVRHNLTVTFDGNPQTHEPKRYLPELFAANGVEVISSLPYYQEYFTDKQRGRGVFRKSIDSIRLLNERGYGIDGSGLVLNLVYNPVGAFLPASQTELEQHFKRELAEKHGVHFNRLFALANMPINRFRKQLHELDQLDDYMERLRNAFNPRAAEGVMCRFLVSVGPDGKLYDCDFNQMLSLEVTAGAPHPMTIFDFDYVTLLERRIVFAGHCLGCTAGAGSSCGGATA